MSIENVRNPVLSLATQRYRRNLLIVASAAFLTWWYGDAFDYAKWSPLNDKDIAKSIALKLILGGLLFNGLIYALYAYREIREWINGVLAPDASEPDLRVHMYKMYFTNGPVKGKFGGQEAEFTCKPDTTGSLYWWMKRTGTDDPNQKPGSYLEWSQSYSNSVRSRNHIDIVFLGIVVPGISLVVGLFAIVSQMNDCPKKCTWEALNKTMATLTEPAKKED